MKIKIYVQLLIIAITANINGPLYSQENNSGNMENNEYKQREQAIKNHIRQEREKGKNLEEIFKQPDGIIHQFENTIEAKAYSQMIKMKKNSWKYAYNNACICSINMSSCKFLDFIDTPSCKSMENDYIKIETECKKLEKIHANTPETNIYSRISDFLNEYKVPSEEFKRLTKEKQKIDKTDKEIKELLEEIQIIEKNIIPKLFQEKQELLYSLSLY